MKDKLRSKVAEMIYNKDISVDGVTIRELVDLFLEFGEYCSREGYRTGKVHEVLKNPDFNEETFIKENFS